MMMMPVFWVQLVKAEMLRNLRSYLTAVTADPDCYEEGEWVIWDDGKEFARFGASTPYATVVKNSPKKPGFCCRQHLTHPIEGPSGFTTNPMKLPLVLPIDHPLGPPSKEAIEAGLAEYQYFQSALNAPPPPKFMYLSEILRVY